MAHTHTHNHHHGHGCDHDHGAQTPATIATAVILFSLATVEWFAGKGLNNPGVIADAGHNFSDAIFALAVVLMIPIISVGRKVFSGSHFMKCNIESLVAIIIAFTTIAMIAYFSIEQVLKGVSTEHSELVLLIGIVSLGYQPDPRKTTDALEQRRDEVARSSPPVRCNSIALDQWSRHSDPCGCLVGLECHCSSYHFVASCKAQLAPHL